MCILSPWRIHHGWQGRFANLPKAQDYELPMLYVWESIVDHYCIILQVSQHGQFHDHWIIDHWLNFQVSMLAVPLKVAWSRLSPSPTSVHQVGRPAKWALWILSSLALFKWHPLLKLEEENRSRIMRQLKHLHTQAPKQAIAENAGFCVQYF